MFSLLMASNRRHSTRTRKIREKKQQTKKNYITNVAVDECDFRIYCGVLEIQNRGVVKVERIL